MTSPRSVEAMAIGGGASAAGAGAAGSSSAGAASASLAYGSAGGRRGRRRRRRRGGLADQRAVEVHGEPHVAGAVAGGVTGSGVAAVGVQRVLAGDELQRAVVALGRREDAGVEARADGPVGVDDDRRPRVGARAVARRDGVDVVDEAVQREAVGARHHLAEVGLADLGGELGRLGGRRRRRRRRGSRCRCNGRAAGWRRRPPRRRRRRGRRRRARRATGSASATGNSLVFMRFTTPGVSS